MTTFTNVARVCRAYRFRLYPTPAQCAELDEWMRQLRGLWNLAHEQRLAALARPRGERPGEELATRARECKEMAARRATAWLRDLEAGQAATAREHLRAAKARLRESRDLYAKASDERVDYYRQSPEMTELLREAADPVTRDQLGRVVCSARQEILRDLDKAWQRWRKRLGGKPHFKRRTDSVRIYLSTPKHWKVELGSLVLAGVAASVGPIEIKQDRPWPGDAKFTSCHLVRDVDQWFAVFPLEFTRETKRAMGQPVGINRGAVHALADSDGRVVDSPGYYAQAMGRIGKLARDLDRKRKAETAAARDAMTPQQRLAELDARLGAGVGAAKERARLLALIDSGQDAALAATPPVLGRNRHKARVKLAKAHRRVRRQREWFLHQESKHYADRHAIIGVEDWSTREMTAKEPDERIAPTRERKRALNRSILDVGWYELVRQLRYKAEATGAEVRAAPVFDPEVERIGISSVCSVCGAALKAPASGRKNMLCDDCGHGEIGDVNCARNVLVRAMNPSPTPKKRPPKVSIKITGRGPKGPRSATAAKQAGDGYGGDSPAREPGEVATVSREGDLPERTVVPG